ncbi:trypsin Inhibitor like cysteine rich domain protein [Ancylostoma ceylanicum]|uniref:Trypsin Inhibitor like cysteine rich domain protein n=1 Tax=Ancylostoma ceylanicum TaxID=53326 RepID=A0A0D6LMD5_9BILA|nr:trypsin Inhibitor like cysteine rich domain protein [Ancylostoma ceylanicum]
MWSILHHLVLLLSLYSIVESVKRDGVCQKANCGQGWRCIPIEGKARCLPVPNPCDTFSCASDEDCALDHGLPYCQKKITSCPQNETRQECGSLCEGLCLITVLGNLTCGVPDVCSWPSCACNEGYYRDAFGHCVLEQDCFPDAACFASPPPCKETEACSVEDGKVICIPALICGQNEEYNDCGNSCEARCENLFKKFQSSPFDVVVTEDQMLPEMYYSSLCMQARVLSQGWRLRTEAKVSTTLRTEKTGKQEERYDDRIWRRTDNAGLILETASASSSSSMTYNRKYLARAKLQCNEIVKLGMFLVKNCVDRAPHPPFFPESEIMSFLLIGGGDIRCEQDQMVISNEMREN